MTHATASAVFDESPRPAGQKLSPVSLKEDPVSRASRQFRRWERRTRERAWQDARRFALDLYWKGPRPQSYEVGVVLEEGEQLHRAVWVSYSTLGRTPDYLDGQGRLRHGSPYWRDWGWCQTLLTSHRLASRLANDGDRLISNCWPAILGVEVDLEADAVVLEDGVGEWRGLYRGPATAIIAVAAIEHLYGTTALSEYPGLQSIRL